LCIFYTAGVGEIGEIGENLSSERYVFNSLTYSHFLWLMVKQSYSKRPVTDFRRWPATGAFSFSIDFCAVSLPALRIVI